MDLKGKTAIVTGGVSGLGNGAARRFIANGARVAMFDVNRDRGRAAEEELGENARFFEVDVTDREAVAAAVQGVAELWGEVHVLVNAAGIAPAMRTVSRDGSLFDLDLFRTVIEVNLIGMFDVIRNVAGVMARNEPNEEGERGVIVNVASIAAFEGQVGQAAYSASKGGVVGMTLPIARDLGALGIRVCTIAPGIMDTPLLAAAPPELKEALGKIQVFPQRLGRPDEFAHLVQAIVENPMLNGEVIRLDAGARMPAK
ncbi:MAG: SDR family NAD(P)-dependent oxidoreductase [Actinomycetes bacterium]|jgi:3-hydroxyacyl-CoA dehydrogenase/3-hydroxy-2-methylbutyryl-CoA dehydrogenase|nr:MAG: 3-hydroxyacyl-CoA dehydrogenase [Actinomycetota bacterium]